MSNDPSLQQPCVHCGDCARACPDTLNPEALFFALVRDDFPSARTARLDACSECNRCTEVCPSHIPLLDWFRWGKSELAGHARADETRNRFEARNARLARERAERAARRREVSSHTTLPAQTISHAEVLAAIRRGRARKAAVVKSQAKDGRSGASGPETAPLADAQGRGDHG
ncbi:MAG TPA: 4Fe-4S dicluster domain-containing protein [Rhodanobacteraceae bacterium]|nr:4Fe-4S dicluster domain-containing protein [Rhodanobacteraceae bacterium]